MKWKKLEMQLYPTLTSTLVQTELIKSEEQPHSIMALFPCGPKLLIVLHSRDRCSGALDLIKIPVKDVCTLKREV